MPRDDWGNLAKCSIQKNQKTNKIPNDWRRNIAVPIYKNKEVVQDCSNYRGIKLMGHTVKLWERVIEIHMRRCTSISENQFGFMLGWSTMEAIHLMRQTMEYYSARKRDLHIVLLTWKKHMTRYQEKCFGKNAFLKNTLIKCKICIEK